MDSVPVTCFRGVKFTKPKEHTSLDKVLEMIASDKWKARIEKCRIDPKAKDWLPCFTPTGTFSHRSIKGLDLYNGIICLDVDNIPLQSDFKLTAEDLKNLCKTLPWVHAMFITPSGNGLKVLVRTNATTETYKETEEKVASMFKSFSNIERDNHCKDIARIQFISYDPDLYYNPESEIVEKAETPLIDFQS